MSKPMEDNLRAASTVVFEESEMDGLRMLSARSVALVLEKQAREFDPDARYSGAGVQAAFRYIALIALDITPNAAHPDGEKETVTR